MIEPVTITAVGGIPEVHEGDDLPALLAAGLEHSGLRPIDGDILVVSSKIASKALGLVSQDPDKDRVIASQTVEVVAERAVGDRVTRVVRGRAGPIMAAAGVDGSNTGTRGGWLLLPDDPDGVCRHLHAGLTARYRVRLGIVLSDTAGRPWRVGQTDFALGAHGLSVLDDLRGGRDADDRPLQVTVRAVADEVAAAADLVKGKSRAVPAALVRGLAQLVPNAPDGPGAADLVRTGPGDWFALGRVEAVRAALGIEPGSAAARAAGLAPTAGDTERDALRRAVAVALHGVPTGRADLTATTIVLGADGPFALGLLTARLLAALHAERLPASAGPCSVDGCSVTVTLARDDG